MFWADKLYGKDYELSKQHYKADSKLESLKDLYKTA